MTSAWLFLEPESTEVILLDRILDGEAPILLVTHDEDEPAWQFLDGEHVFEDDACLVRLGEVAQLDPSILELADLPVGGYAWRTSAAGPWHRAQGEPPSLLPEQPEEPA